MVASSTTYSSSTPPSTARSCGPANVCVCRSELSARAHAAKNPRHGELPWCVVALAPSPRSWLAVVEGIYHGIMTIMCVLSDSGLRGLVFISHLSPGICTISYVITANGSHTRSVLLLLYVRLVVSSCLFSSIPSYT
jgi:hypothetical protein